MAGNVRGSEKVLAELLALFPDASLFAVVDFLPDEHREKLRGKRARTSFIQKLPFAAKHYRSYLPLMPLAVEQFDLSGYDLIISSNHAVAKGRADRPRPVHICYCHTPIRYAWDLQHQYLREANLTRGIKSLLARLVLHYIRSLGHALGHGGGSLHRQFRLYRQTNQKGLPAGGRRRASPVDVEAFPLALVKEGFYLTASRMVPYKRMDIIVEAFAQMPERRLVVIGDGPEMGKLRALGRENITFLGYQDDSVLRGYLQRALGFVFAAEEDFGILPVEAQACGTPVIAYGAGGALETVLPAGNEQGLPATGLFFTEQTPEAVRAGIIRFEALCCRSGTLQRLGQQIQPRRLQGGDAQ